MQMFHLLPPLVVLAFSSGIVAMAAAQKDAADSQEKERAAITRTVEQFRDSWNKHDAHEFALTFTEDADFTNVAGVHEHGRANVESFHAERFATWFKDSHQTTKIRSVRFLSPGLAAVDVEWEMTGAKLPSGDSIPLRKGLLNFVMARQSDGLWLIEVMHNTDLTSPLGAAK